MKLDVEVLDGVLVIRNEEETFKIVIEVVTGEVIYFEHLETDIDRLVSFVTKARSRYRKFCRSEEAEEFIE